MNSHKASVAGPEEPTSSPSKEAVATSSKEKSLESWVWDAACSIRGAKDAPKYKEFILPLIFAKRLCDVYDDELDRMAAKVGGRKKAFVLAKQDKQLVRFYLPIEPKDTEESVWSVIRTLSDKIGEQLTTHLRAIADANPLLKGIIDRVDFNATTHGVRDLDDDRLSNLIEAISAKRLGLDDVEPDIIGRSYEYLIRKFAEGSVSSAGEFYTPKEVGIVMARIMDPEPGMDVYDPCCGSAGLLVKCELVLNEKADLHSKGTSAPLRLYGQEYIGETWAMANMNMIIHDMEGTIELGDTFKNPKLRSGNRLRTFDRVVANPMWNQDWWIEADYDADDFNRFPKGAGYPGNNADWGWVQIIFASMKPSGRAAVVLDTGAASRGSGNVSSNKEREVRRWFLEQDLIEGVLQLPENLFYNTTAAGLILFLDRSKVGERKNKLLLVNGSQAFEKGRPKNFLPDGSIDHIVDVFREWTEQTYFSRIVSLDEIVRNDFNISPSRYVRLGGGNVHRPLSEIADELRDLTKQAMATEQDVNALLEALIAKE